MNGILNLDFMHYTTVGSLEMSDEPNKILSAQLLVKFTKPRKMEEEDYEKLLGAYMKPISDADGVTFKLKNGKKITGSNILRTKNVEIEMIDDVRISEPALIQEMEEFLRELNSEL